MVRRIYGNNFILLSTIYLQYNDLVQLEVERRTDLKWNYLLERCKFYVKVSFVYIFQDAVPQIRLGISSGF